MLLWKTMNSEVDKSIANFIINCTSFELLKSLPTSIEVDNWDANFNPIEASMRFVGLCFNLICLKSALVADFSSGELGNWVVEFSLKIIISDFKN